MHNAFYSDNNYIIILKEREKERGEREGERASKRETERIKNCRDYHKIERKVFVDLYLVVYTQACVAHLNQSIVLAPIHTDIYDSEISPIRIKPKFRELVMNCSQT